MSSPASSSEMTDTVLGKRVPQSLDARLSKVRRVQEDPFDVNELLGEKEMAALLEVLPILEYSTCVVERVGQTTILKKKSITSYTPLSIRPGDGPNEILLQTEKTGHLRGSVRLRFDLLPVGVKFARAFVESPTEVGSHFVIRKTSHGTLFEEKEFIPVQNRSLAVFVSPVTSQGRTKSEKLHCVRIFFYRERNEASMIPELSLSITDLKKAAHSATLIAPFCTHGDVDYPTKPSLFFICQQWEFDHGCEQCSLAE